jgi:hypothetical protein
VCNGIHKIVKAGSGANIPGSDGCMARNALGTQDDGHAQGPSGRFFSYCGSLGRFKAGGPDTE